MSPDKEQKLLEQWNSMHQYEDALYAAGFRYIAGIDEAGRGPLAGPVTAAAVILPRDAYIPGLNDSKKISEKKRIQLADEIKKTAVAWSCIHISHDVIDEINILEAAKLAMIRSVETLTQKPDHLLIDALKLDLAIPQQGIIKGDALSVSIAAASIIAKTTRDQLMLEYDQMYPEYQFAKHKGYPTPIHKELLRKYGPSPIHRRTFRY